jgi:uncharacterized membrane protein SpoIIM required for sporulation
MIESGMTLIPESAAPAVARWRSPAGWAEVGRWAAVAAIVAVVLLSSVAIIAAALPGNADVGFSSGLLTRHHALGLFLLEARRGRLDRLGLWSLQAAAVALPVLLCAAVIETYVTPALVIAAR